MPAKGVVARKLDGRADEQDRLTLKPAKRNFIDGSDTVDVGRAVRYDEVCRIDHAQVDVQCLPVVTGQLRTGSSAIGRILEGPGRTCASGVDTLLSILVESAHLRLVPGIEHDGPQITERLADPGAPAVRLFGFS